MLNMLIMGPAGAGKGTMSELIVENYQLPHISSGDMFRENIKLGTSLGLKANEYIIQGKLVPDDVTIEMVKDRLSKDDCVNGYLLDGFPRSLPQAVAIDDLGINVVINLVVNEEALVDRIVNRRICSLCGSIYNTSTLDSLVCPKCGGELYQRSDDTYEKLMTRLESYKNETEPVIDYYRKKGVVYDVDAGRPIEEVFASINKILIALKEDID